uniref:Helicase C-terminal domain-containing protein n=1 Tax=Hucho hucho TaxID=62062 RepID=A0A4W5PV99_9TELE
GSHSTKVEAVVRTLKKIQLTDPGAKCLVFSTWQCVLDIIAKALFDNNMEFSQINGIHKFQVCVACHSNHSFCTSSQWHNRNAFFSLNEVYLFY